MKRLKAKASSDLKCKWYLAEDIRQEIGGKVSILGLFADDTVVIEMPVNLPDPTPENPIAIEGLAILCTLIGNSSIAKSQGAGYEFLLHFGTTEAMANKKQLLVMLPAEPGSVNLISRFRPIVVQEFGEKLFRIECARLEFKEDFKFQIQRRNIAAIQVSTRQPVAPKRAGKSKARPAQPPARKSRTVSKK